MVRIQRIQNYGFFKLYIFSVSNLSILFLNWGFFFQNYFSYAFLFLGGTIFQQECNFFLCCIYHSTKACEAYNLFFVVFSLHQYKIWGGLFLQFYFPYNNTTIYFLNMLRLNIARNRLYFWLQSSNHSMNRSYYYYYMLHNFSLNVLYIFNIF